MSQIDKLLEEIRCRPRTVRFADLRRVLEYHGVCVRPGKGSHRVAERDGNLYTIKDPGSGFLHPKTVKHCLQAFGLWE